MSKQVKVLLIVGVCLFAFLRIFYNLKWRVSETEKIAVVKAPDSSNHPVYSKYDFGGANENVIDFGVQPLWVPTNLISETMKRDSVLGEALSEQGLNIRFHAVSKGADVNFFLPRGDLEVGIGGDMPPLTAAAGYGALIAALSQPGFCSIIADRYMLMKELKGKRIGYSFGSNAHYALLQTLSSAGLMERDVRLVSLDFTEMPDELDRGKIDAFSAWEPTPTLALAQFKYQVVIHRSLSSGYLFFHAPLPTDIRKRSI